MPRHSNETEVAEFKQKNWSSKPMNDTSKALIGMAARNYWKDEGWHLPLRVEDTAE